MRISLLAFTVLLPTMAFALPTTLVTTAASDVDLYVSGLIGSGTYQPSFSGSADVDLTFSGPTLTAFDIIVGSYIIAADSYTLTTPGILTSIATSDITFTLSAASLIVGAGSGPDNYTLSGNITLTADSGTVSGFAGPTAYGVLHDFTTDPSPLNVTLVNSEVTIDTGTTNVGLTLLRFNTVNAFNSAPIASLDISSLNTIEMTAVPEPRAYALLLGLSSIGFVAARRRRK